MLGLRHPWRDEPEAPAPTGGREAREAPEDEIRAWRVLRADGREVIALESSERAHGLASSFDGRRPDLAPHRVERWDNESGAWVPEVLPATDTPGEGR
jgi:hypothetical protein